MEKLVLANALANIDFDLLISDDIVNKRGYWGEILEIRLPERIIFVYVDENCQGFIKLYRKTDEEYTRIREITITKDNLHEELKKAINESR